jgi:hypothetical protein
MKADRISPVTLAYVSAVLVLTGVCVALLWRGHGSAASLAVFLSITLLGMLAHAFPIRAPRNQAYQVSLPFIIVASALFSTPQLVLFVALIHLAEYAHIRRPAYIQLFNFGDYLLSALLAALFYQRASAMMPSQTLSSIEAAMAAGCAFIVLNRMLLAGALWVARSISPARAGLLRADLLAADLIIIWIAGPMLVLTSQAGALMLLVTAGPLCLARIALAWLLARSDPSINEVPAKAA